MLNGRRYENKFIVYIHTNPATREIFYVGIGVKGREKQKYKRSTRWRAYVRKYGFEFAVVYSDLNWNQACEIEIQLIQEIGRLDYNSGPLINMTNGGDGVVGYEGYWKGKERPPASDETKLKCKENSQKFWLGKKHSEETKAKIRIKRASQDMKVLSESKKGKPTWNKGVNMWNGKIHPRGMAGKIASEETRRKMSLSRIGRKRNTVNKIVNERITQLNG